MIAVSAPGKIHLLGEHSVVYGKPAILTAVDRRTTITLTERRDDFVVITTPDLSQTAKLTQEQIIEKTVHARRIWEEFTKTNNKNLLQTITATPIDFAILAIGESLLHFSRKLSKGLAFSANSTIFQGSGMGSSSALAVAIAGAFSVFFNQKLDKEIINTIAFETEKKRHGFPSGGDNTASTYGGFIWYQKNDKEKTIKNLPISLSKNIQQSCSLLFTGNPIETTGDMVSFVRKQYEDQKEKVDHIFSDQSDLVIKLKSALERDDLEEIKKIITNGERNLEKIGVVSPASQKIMREIEKLKGAAKICGAGGIKKSSGVILVVHQDQKMIQKIANYNNIIYSPVALGQEGVRIEK